MNELSSDIQATYQIVDLLEVAKRQSEGVLDRIPAIFAVIGPQGDILRGNKLLSDSLACDVEALIYKNLREAFRQEEWKLFQKYMQDGFAGKINSFELTMRNPQGEPRIFLWYITSFKTPQKGEYLALIGKDLTELREVENKLNTLFASVPLGVMSIGSYGVIQGDYSSFTEVLFQGATLRGRSIFDLLFDQVKGMSFQQEKALEDLFQSVGRAETFYDGVLRKMPHRVLYKSNEKKMWLHLTYQPVVFEGRLEKILLILQDISTLVSAERIQKKQDELEKDEVQRVLAVRRLDESTAELIFDELDQLFLSLERSLLNSNYSSMKNNLHGIKGCSRIAGFKTLCDLSHRIEGYLDDELVESSKDIIRLKEEWENLFSLYKVFQSSSFDHSEKPPVEEGAIQCLSEIRRFINGVEKAPNSSLALRKIYELEKKTYRSFHDMAPLIQKNVEKIASSLGKEVSWEWSAYNLYLNPQEFKLICDCLIHLINNALDHGIETPEERLMLGKVAQGKLIIRGSDTEGQILITVEDDGQGVDYSRVRNKAYQLGLYTLDELKKVKERELMSLLFTEDFSTSSVVTGVSGRGVGLFSVRESVRIAGGEVWAETKHGRSMFAMEFPSVRTNKAHLALIEIKTFVDVLKKQAYEYWNELLKQGDELPEIECLFDLNKQNGKIHIQESSAILAVCELVRIFCKQGTGVLLKLHEASAFQIEFRAESLKDKADEYYQEVAEEILKENHGRFSVFKGKMLIEFNVIR